MPSEKIGGISLYTPYKKWIREIIEAKSEPIKKLEKEQNRIDEASRDLKKITSKLYKLRFMASDLSLASTFYEENVQNSNPQVADVAVKSKRLEGTFTIDVRTLASPHKIMSDALPVGKPVGVGGEITIKVGDKQEKVQISKSDDIDLIVSKFNATGLVDAYRIDKYIVLQSKETGSSGKIAVSGEAASKLGFIESSFVEKAGTKKWSHNFSSSRSFKLTFEALAPGKYTVFVNGRKFREYDLPSKESVDEKPSFSPTDISLSIDGATSVKVESDTGTIGEVKVQMPDVIKNEIARPQDAVFYLNGVKIVRSSNENIKDVVPGMVINLRSPGRTILSIQKSPTGGKEAIVQFVKAYNDLLKSIYDYENKYGSDLALEMLSTRLRSIVLGRYETEYGEAIFPMFGISTGKPGSSWDEVKFGFLYVDEKKLQKALETDFQKFLEFLGYDKDGDGIKDTGMAVSLKKYLDSVVGPDGIMSAKQDALANRKKTLQDEIAMRKERLEREKERLVAEFSKLEQVMADYENQKRYISSFGIIKGGSSSSMFKNEEEESK